MSQATLPSPSLAELDLALARAADPREHAAAALALARALRNQDPARGAALAAQAAEQALSLGEAGLQAQALAVQGHCLRNAGELAAAARTGRRALELFARLPAERALQLQQSQALSHLGISLCLLGRHEAALTEFEAARGLSREIGDRTGEADAMMNIAIVANQLGDDERAIALGEQVLPLYEALDDTYHMASVLNNRAYAHVCLARRLGEAGRSAESTLHGRSAIALLERALPLAEREADPAFTVICMDTLSAALRGLGEWARARDHLQEQLRLARLLPGRRMEAVTLGTLGEVLRRQGALEEARQTLEAADRLCAELQLAETHAQILEQLSATLEALGRPAEALALHKRFHALALEHRSQAAASQLQLLEARLQLERSEAELALAREREQTLAALNTRLVAADEQRGALLAELERLSLEDGLTEIANRRAFDQRLHLEVERALRHGGPLALALIDVDHFKQINDGHSHGVGDTVLRRVAQALRQALRATDLPARFGGDEFALLLPDTGPTQALALADKLCQQVAAQDWAALAPALRVSLSIGVAVLTREFDTGPQAHAEAPAALLRGADAALYQAKAAGRNRAMAGPLRAAGAA